MNEADDALSKSARAFTDEPSGVITATQQVMSSALDFNFMAVLVETGVLSLVSPGPPGLCGSTCKRVW